MGRGAVGRARGRQEEAVAAAEVGGSEEGGESGTQPCSDEDP